MPYKNDHQKSPLDSTHSLTPPARKGQDGHVSNERIPALQFNPG